MQRDILYLACTRGARTVGGVPLAGMWVNVYLCYLGYMTVGQADIIHFRGYIWLILFPAIHMGFRFAVERDPNIFRILGLILETFSLRPVLWAAPSRPPHQTRMMQSALV